MDVAVEVVANNWITLQRYENHNRAPEDVFAKGWELYDLVHDQPALGWEIIQAVIDRYSIGELQSETPTEAQRIIGNLAAGPIEDLLSYHGPDFIDQVLVAARRDSKLTWALGGVWQCGMSDEIFQRVRAAAGGAEYWNRPVSSKTPRR